LRIRSLEITGFKSFGDRTVLGFGSGISGIVGPNGCGKSNVIDALRWVMGEQNPRHLRGRSMDDLIFAGTEKRAPVGMAEVVLTLDNSDGRAPEPYAGFSEIQIGRRLYRSGESEYLINKTPCRLRDVTDFFLDTGVGTRGYTIVEQGHIADLVSTRPEDRRVIFEQAAGIGKYRQRRKETESKLASTEQNLLRVRDILGELQRQIGSLDRQARRAARFKKLRAQLRDLELVVASEAFDTDARALGEAERALDAARSESLALEARVAARDADLETARRVHLEREKELQRLSEQLYALRTAIQALESRTAYERRERSGLLELAAEREAEIAQLEEQVVGHTSALAEVVRELALFEARIDDDQRDLARRELALREQAEALAAVQGRREALQARLIELSSEEAALRGRRDALAERQRDLELRLRDRDEALEASALALESLRRDEAGASERLRRALTEQDELQRLFAEQLRQQSEVRAHAESLVAERDALQARLQQAAARLESLREIERREALRAAALIDRLPEASRSTIQGLLPEILEVDDGLESAVEAALAGRLEAVLVNGAEAALALIAQLRETGAGRATVLPLAKNERDPEPGFVPLGRPLASFVRVRGARGALVERLLRDVYLVDDLAAPIERFGIASPPAVFVTRAGELLDRSGAITGGLGAPPGALSRAGGLRRLEAEVADLQERVQGVARRGAEAAARQAALATELENTRNRRHTAELAVVNLDKDLERMRERGKEAADAAQVQREDREALQGLLDRGAEEGSALAPRLDEIARERVRAAELREQLAAEIARRTRELEGIEQRLVQARVQLAELGARRDQSGESRARLETAVADGRDWIARRRDEVAGARERAAELERSCDTASRELALRIAEEDEHRARQSALREGFEASAGQVEAAEQALRAASREREALRDRLAEVELQAHDARSKCEQVAERIRERYDVDIAAYRPPPELLQGEPESRARELDEVRESLRTLGDVNLGSIEEYEEVSERFRYMSEQKTDLEQAIERLRAAIVRINRTSRARFRETFEAVDAEFQRIFPRMFEGGRAHLTLTDGEDVLEAGIDIIAQPPGKKLQNVNLLSGGEKSLTAIALLMAVFSVRPSPFFLLDEVDAALDDANASRFNALLREMARTSQFLLISHNKSSIEVADTLYGVTMQEPGLSKLVTVDLIRDSLDGGPPGETRGTPEAPAQGAGQGGAPRSEA
jgi:chromosome segregation protein